MDSLSPGQIPNSEPLPLVARLNTKSAWGRPKPERSYFFQREDGSVFSCGEFDAYNVWSGRNQMMGEVKPKPKYIGQTDGQIYYKAVLEAQAMFKENGLEASQERLRAGFAESFEDSKLNTKPPRSRDVVDGQGNPIDLRTYGN